MAERHARLKQYDYKANSNLVLQQTDRGPREAEGATGEVESLKGKIGLSEFGSRARVGRAGGDNDYTDRLKKAREKKKKGDAPAGAPTLKKRKITEAIEYEVSLETRNMTIYWAVVM